MSHEPEPHTVASRHPAVRAPTVKHPVTHSHPHPTHIHLTQHTLSLVILLSLLSLLSLLPLAILLTLALWSAHLAALSILSTGVPPEIEHLAQEIVRDLRDSRASHSIAAGLRLREITREDALDSGIELRLLWRTIRSGIERRIRGIGRINREGEGRISTHVALIRRLKAVIPVYIVLSGVEHVVNLRRGHRVGVEHGSITWRITKDAHIHTTSRFGGRPACGPGCAWRRRVLLTHRLIRRIGLKCRLTNELLDSSLELVRLVRIVTGGAGSLSLAQIGV